MTKSFGFAAQLRVGDQGESDIMTHYPRKLELFAGREYDFVEVSSGRTVELKSDTYPMDRTPNFFMEKFSCVERETPGGPWRARGDKVDVFIYYFLGSRTYFQFDDVPALVRRLNKLTKGKGLCYIKNRGWTTGGFKVKRSDLEDLYTEYSWED